jgi:hypothetical protein
LLPIIASAGAFVNGALGSKPFERHNLRDLNWNNDFPRDRLANPRAGVRRMIRDRSGASVQDIDSIPMSSPETAHQIRISQNSGLNEELVQSAE